MNPLILRNPTFPSPAAAMRALGIRRDRLARGYARACERRRMWVAAKVLAALKATNCEILRGGKA